MGPALGGAGLARRTGPIDRRVWRTSVTAVGIAVVAALIAQLSTKLIAFITNFAFYGQFSLSSVSPAGNHAGGDDRHLSAEKPSRPDGNGRREGRLEDNVPTRPTLLRTRRPRAVRG
jgi:hypothetical protein